MEYTIRDRLISWRVLTLYMGDYESLKPIQYFWFETDIFDISVLRSYICLDALMNFLVLIWYKKITYFPDLTIPFQTNSGQYCSWYRYSNISILIFGAFQNRYCKLFAKPIWHIGLLHSATIHTCWNGENIFAINPKTW